MFADLNGAIFPRTWLSVSKSRTWWQPARTAKPTKIILVEPTVPWRFSKERQQGMKEWWKIWSRVALMHAISLSRSDVGELGMLQTLNISATSKGLSGRELIKVQTWWHDFPSSCFFVNSNHVFIFHYAGSLGATIPLEKIHFLGLCAVGFAGK